MTLHMQLPQRPLSDGQMELRPSIQAKNSAVEYAETTSSLAHNESLTCTYEQTGSIKSYQPGQLRHCYAD